MKRIIIVSFIIVAVAIYVLIVHKSRQNNSEWKYGEGYYIGDFLYFTGEENSFHKIQDNYILKGKDTLALVESNLFGDLIIKSLERDTLGYYDYIGKYK